MSVKSLSSSISGHEVLTTAAHPPLNSLKKMPRKNTREMVGGCCVCSDERGWDENPLVYCDGQGCNVAVHQACYGIVQVPTGPWFCRKCESQERAARVRCELCPSRDGALKRTDTNSWAHVVCALYIPEVRFGNVSTMEPIVLGLVPQERYLKVCYLCEQQGRESKATSGACMQCNKSGCKQTFHVTCAQGAGLLCEEAGNYQDNVKYCGYCEPHFQRINKKIIKTIPAYKPVPAASPDSSPEKKASNDLSSQAPVSPGSPTSSNDASSRKSKKGRRPNSAASDHNDKPTNNSLVPNYTAITSQDENSVAASAAVNERSGGGPTALNTSSSSSASSSSSGASSSSKQSSTSSLTDAASTSSPETKDPPISAQPPSAPQPSLTSESKQAPVIVKLAKSESGVYKKVNSDPVNEPEKKSTENGNSASSLEAKSDSKNDEPVEPSSSVSVTMTTSSSAAELSKKSTSAYDFNASEHNFDEAIPPMRKDSPAKIIPLNGKPLKIETSSENKDIAKSQVSPTKVNAGGGSTVQGGTRFSKTGKRIGRPPKKGTLLANSSLGTMASTTSSNPPVTNVKRQGSPPSSPENGDDFASSSSSAKRRKTSPSKRLTNGNGNSNAAMMWMMGATLNNSSSAAREMDMVLKSEISSHSAYDPASKSPLHGVPVPGKKQRSSLSTTSQNSGGGSGESTSSKQPQTLEELLERQWEQGSQFLMEQASHFDIASLLSSLHQLKEENVELKDSVDHYVQRRDHLLAVRARLMALNNLNIAASSASSGSNNISSNSVTNGPIQQAPQQASAPQSSSRSTQQSPRNSAATVSPIRVVDRAITSPRTGMHAPSLPPPPAHSPRQLTSPRDRLTGPPPPSHSGLPSPRSSPRTSYPPPPAPMENGGGSGDYIPQPSGVSVSRSAIQQQHHLLTVVSTAASMSRSGLPPPPPRQSSSYSMPPSAHGMMRQPPGVPPPPPSHGGIPRGAPGMQMGRPMHGYGPPPGHPGHPSGPPPPGHYVMDRGPGRSLHEKR